jgi:phage tail-like protein
MTISLLDDDVSTPIVTWIAKDVWPLKYTGPDFDATSSNLAVEKMDVCCRTIERMPVTGGDTMGATYGAPPA